MTCVLRVYVQPLHISLTEDFVSNIVRNTYCPDPAWDKRVLNNDFDLGPVFLNLSVVLRIADRSDRDLAVAVCTSANLEIQERVGVSVTHLLVDDYATLTPEDRKLEEHFDLCVVTPDWLFASAESQEVLPETWFEVSPCWALERVPVILQVYGSAHPVRPASFDAGDELARADMKASALQGSVYDGVYMILVRYALKHAHKAKDLQQYTILRVTKFSVLRYHVFPRDESKYPVNPIGIELLINEFEVLCSGQDMQESWLGNVPKPLNKRDVPVVVDDNLPPGHMSIWSSTASASACTRRGGGHLGDACGGVPIMILHLFGGSGSGHDQVQQRLRTTFCHCDPG